MATPLNSLAKKAYENDLKPTTIANLTPASLASYLKPATTSNIATLSQGPSPIINFATFNGDSSPQMQSQLTAIAVTRDLKTEGNNPVTTGTIKSPIIIMGKNQFTVNEFGSVEIISTRDEPNGNMVLTQEKCNGTDSKKAEPEEASCSVCKVTKKKEEFFKQDFCSESCFRKKSCKKPKPILPKSKKRKNEGEEEAVPIKRSIRPAPSTTSNNNGTEAPSFNWSKYLIETNSEAAPSHIFKDACQGLPTGKNLFRKGMRLEGIDPKHPSMFCVLSVLEIRGTRIKLHFDGYANYHDFWVNSNSKDIFPAGWCSANNHELTPPLGYDDGAFEWSAYLKEIKAIIAPKEAFVNQIRPTSYHTHLFKKGMKLEAVDKNDPNHPICVATVADVMEDRFLVHFDDWHEMYDYWARSDSPYIHPISWCQDNGYELLPPINYEPSSFSWSVYLHKTKSVAAPLKAFKKRSPNGFQVGMKLEATDRRCPSFIRVATVVGVKSHMIQIHYDGSPHEFDAWIDDDCPDIHPINWCQGTFHPLEAPLKPVQASNASHLKSPISGCQGVGHFKIKERNQSWFVCSMDSCPYSSRKLDSDSQIPDRLGTISGDETLPNSVSPAKEVSNGAIEGLRKCPTPGCDGSGNVLEKYTFHHGVASCPLAERNLTNGQNLEPSVVKAKPGRKSKRSRNSSSQEDSNDEVVYIKESKLRKMVIDTFTFGYPFQDPPTKEFNFYANTILHPILETLSYEEVQQWSVEEVGSLVVKITEVPEAREVIAKHKLDGLTFMLLTHEDLVTFLKFKMGVAAKISSAISRIRYNEYLKKNLVK